MLENGDKALHDALVWEIAPGNMFIYHCLKKKKKKAFLHLNPSSAVKLSESWGLSSLHHCKIVWQGQALDVYGYYLWCELLYKTDVSVKVVFHRSVCGMDAQQRQTEKEREDIHTSQFVLASP